LQDVGAQSGPDRGAYALVSLIGILLRADPRAVGVLIAAVVVVAAITAVIAVCSCCRSADRRAVDTRADRRARYRAISIAASRNPISIAAPRNPISPTGNAVTTSTNCPAPEMGGAAASVKASSSDAAATAPTSERVIRDEAGTEENGGC
jgi:hypothetical protein